MLTYLVLGALSTAVFKWLLPEYYFEIYPAIVILYWAYGMVLNGVLSRKRFENPEKMTNTFMIFRIVKLALTVLILVIGVNFVGENKMSFGISIAANYLIYMVLELYIYYMYNKRSMVSNARKR